MFSLSDYSYDLPPELIAQTPADRRDASRLMMLNRKTGVVRHSVFSDITTFLTASDVLVVNNTKVIPGRLIGKKETGGKVEVLILNYGSEENNQTESKDKIYDCIVKSSKPLKRSSHIFFGKDLTAEVLDRKDDTWMLKFMCEDEFETVLNRIGRVPLPPYIKRDETEFQDDRTSYQTIYAAQAGAIAAPTAGFHFTAELLKQIRSLGVTIVDITLHVGYGTFLPVRTLDIRRHRMHSEWYSLSDHAAEIINTAKMNGGRIIAVGTTSVRTLEYASNSEGKLAAGKGFCDLFIYPGSVFKIVDAMITNFHLPESTLLMLVSAFAGFDVIKKAYQEAIAQKYRFYSYGDAMLIY